MYKEFTNVTLKIIANTSTAAKNNRSGSFSYVTQSGMIFSFILTTTVRISARRFLRTSRGYVVNWSRARFLKWHSGKEDTYTYLLMDAASLKVNSVCLQVRGTYDKRPPANLAAAQLNMRASRTFAKTSPATSAYVSTTVANAAHWEHLRRGVQNKVTCVKFNNAASPFKATN